MKKYYLFAVLLLIVATSCNRSNQTVSEHPNILLIMADDIMPSQFSCYGGGIPTPHIDALANEGMRFTNAYCVSAACTPSRFSVMTGKYPGRCQNEEFLTENPVDQPYNILWNTPIDEKDVTLHEILHSAGYYTGFVGKFHIGELDFDKPELNPAFIKIPEELDPDLDMTDSVLHIHQQLLVERVKELTGCDFAGSIQWENPETLPIKAVQKHNLEWMTNGAAEFFKNRDQSKPFFLHFNTTALHGPNHYDDLKSDARYTPSGRMENPYAYHPERRTIFERLDKLGIKHGEGVADYINHYNSGIIYLDDQIAALQKMLEENDLIDNTIIIVTSDHGIEPGKSVHYQVGVNVPFIVKWPGKVAGGQVSNEVVQFVDFLPTFADIANSTLTNNFMSDGVSFKPALFNEKIDRDYIYFEMGYSRGLTNGKYKLISTRYPSEVVEKLKAGEFEAITHFGKSLHGHAYIAAGYHPGYFEPDQLYDLENDPFEQNNLAGLQEYNELLTEMKNVLEQKVNSFKHPYPYKDVSWYELPQYKQAVKNTMERGTDFIPWWNRDIDYPPTGKPKHYF